MKEKINELLEEIRHYTAENLDTLEQFRIRFLGRKGILQDLFEEFKSLSADHKKDLGQLLNQLKNAAQEKINELKDLLESSQGITREEIDLTRPANFRKPGTRHPINLVRN